jgi:hypothetical protein
MTRTRRRSASLTLKPPRQSQTLALGLHLWCTPALIVDKSDAVSSAEHQATDLQASRCRASYAAEHRDKIGVSPLPSSSTTAQKKAYYMTLNLSQMSLQSPQFSDGALASARLPFLAQNDAAGLANAAASLGMNQVATNEFVHPVDGSWAVMNQGRLERGVGNTLFRGVPTNLATLPALASHHPCSAAAVNVSGPNVVANLISAGFIETSKSFFAHPDASWVAITPDVGVLRGYGQNLLNAAAVGAAAYPASPATPGNDMPAVDAGQMAPAAPAAPPPFDVGTLPTRNPNFEDCFLACAMPGRLDPAAAQRAPTTALLLQQGFVETKPGYFQHPSDTSWVAFTARGTVERGVAGERFNRVPVNPTRLSQVNPQRNAFVLSVADPALQSLTLAQIQQSDAALVAAGFTRSAGAHAIYSHPDGCFIALTPNQTYVGQNQQIFSTLPQPLDVKNAVQPRPEYAYFAVARAAGLPVDAALPQALLDLGFAATVPGVLYSHSDGSWVAVQGSALFLGMNAELLASVPTPPPPGSITRDTSRPPLPDATGWAYWQQNVAIGKLPILSGRPEDMATLASLGFVMVGSEWLHPDGTWVNFQQRPPLGWKGYHLGELPYNNRRPNA